MTSLYDPYPKTKIEGHQGELIQGWESILSQLQEKMEDVLVVDTYPGVYDEEIKHELKKIPHDVWIDAIELFKDQETIYEQLKYHITDDRVFGRMYYGEIENFIVEDKKKTLQEQAQKARQEGKKVIVYGYGAI